MSRFRLVLTLVRRSLLHPTLGVALLRVSWRFRSRHWYRRPPFLPVPDPEYVRWRMYTAYGSAETIPPARDIERYARWATSEH